MGARAIVSRVAILCLTSSKAHLSVLLIKLEILGLFLLSCFLLRFLSLYRKSLVIFLLLRILVSEAAIGLSFLVINSRHLSHELSHFLV